VIGRGVEREAQARREPHDDRQLHEEHERAAGHRPPRQDGREPRQRGSGTERDERRDHRRIPHDWRRVRDQKPVVAIQDAKTPRRQHHHPRARKQDTHKLNGQFARRPREARRDRVDQQRRGDDPDQDDGADREREDREHRAGDTVRFVALASGKQRRVDRDERCRQRAFAE
jgi:hypothetical protein